MKTQTRQTDNGEKGLLIAFEGISASGKSKGISELVTTVEQFNWKYVIIKWNSNAVIRKLIFTLQKFNLLSPFLYSILQQISFMLDYLFKIIPGLKRNDIVIADRYIYTAMTRDVVNGARKKLKSFLYWFIRKPDLLFFFDTPVEVCCQRINRRDKKLFHTNRQIAMNRELKNPDLFYLNLLREEYGKLLCCKRITGKTRVIVIDHLYRVFIKTAHRDFTAMHSVN